MLSSYPTVFWSLLYILSRIPGFDKNKTQHWAEPYSPLKPTKVGFIFIGPNSISRAEDIAAVNHMTQAVVRVGSKIGS